MKLSFTRGTSVSPFSNSRLSVGGRESKGRLLISMPVCFALSLSVKLGFSSLLRLRGLEIGTKFTAGKRSLKNDAVSKFLSRGKHDVVLNA